MSETDSDVSATEIPMAGGKLAAAAFAATAAPPRMNQLASISMPSMPSVVAEEPVDGSEPYCVPRVPLHLYVDYRTPAAAGGCESTSGSSSQAVSTEALQYVGMGAPSQMHHAPDAAGAVHSPPHAGAKSRFRVPSSGKSGGLKSCNHCGATETCQWRHGGAYEDLCNACGLFWAKHGYNKPKGMSGLRRRARKSLASQSTGSMDPVDVKTSNERLSPMPYAIPLARAGRSSSQGRVDIQEFQHLRVQQEQQQEQQQQQGGETDQRGSLTNATHIPQHTLQQHQLQHQQLLQQRHAQHAMQQQQLFYHQQPHNNFYQQQQQQQQQHVPLQTHQAPPPAPHQQQQSLVNHPTHTHSHLPVQSSCPMPHMPSVYAPPIQYRPAIYGIAPYRAHPATTATTTTTTTATTTTAVSTSAPTLTPSTVAPSEERAPLPAPSAALHCPRCHRAVPALLPFPDGQTPSVCAVCLVDSTPLSFASSSQ